MLGFATACSAFLFLMAVRGGMFWSHTIWFVLLGIATLAELAILLWKSPRRMFILAFFFTISGMAFCFEMIVLSFFKAYTYMPKLIPQSPSDDSIAGNLFSQFSVSATAVLLALFRLPFQWYFFISAAYGLIEELFLWLGVYKHNWYHTWMTIALLPILFWIAQKGYDICFKPMWRICRYPFIFLGLVTLHIHTTTWVLKLAGIRFYGEQLFQDKDRSIIVLSLTYTLLLGISIMALYFSRLRWKWKLPIIVVIYCAIKIAEHFQFIQYKEGWFFWATSISIWAMYLFTYLLDQMYNQNHPKAVEPNN